MSEPAMQETVVKEPVEDDTIAQSPETHFQQPTRNEAFFSIPVTLELMLASLKMPVSGLMDIHVGSEINLDHQAGSEVTLMVNGSHIAFGHLFLIDPKTRSVGVRVSRLASGEAS